MLVLFYKNRIHDIRLKVYTQPRAARASAITILTNMTKKYICQTSFHTIVHKVELKDARRDVIPNKLLSKLLQNLGVFIKPELIIYTYEETFKKSVTI